MATHNLQQAARVCRRGLVLVAGRLAAADSIDAIDAARLGDRPLTRPDWIEPTLMRMILEGGRISAIDYARALLARTTFAERVRQTFEQYDLLLTPQMPVAAWPADPGPFEGVADLGGRPAHSIFERLPFTYPFNLTGQPAASVPCGFTADRLPVGLQLTGRAWDEATILRLADAYERVSSWSGMHPSM